MYSLWSLEIDHNCVWLHTSILWEGGYRPYNFSGFRSCSTTLFAINSAMNRIVTSAKCTLDFNREPYLFYTRVSSSLGLPFHLFHFLWWSSWSIWFLFYFIEVLICSISWLKKHHPLIVTLLHMSRYKANIRNHGDWDISTLNFFKAYWKLAA